MIIKRQLFLKRTDHMVKQLEENSFDGVILSNVLDVMPKDVSKEVVEDLERVLKPGGYWFIKMNPYYSKKNWKVSDMRIWEITFMKRIIL